MLRFKSSVLNKSLSLLLLCSLVVCGGCAFISWGVAAFAPPQKKPAVYEFPKNKTVLVLVDDLVNPISYEPLKENLTYRINDLLIENNACKDVVGFEKLFRLVTSSPDFNRLRVREIGRRVGADVVLYISIDKFSLKDNPNIALWRGQLEATVRVVDVDGTQLWPVDRPAGHRMDPLEMPETVETSKTYGKTLANELTDIMGRKIASLFYEHELPRKHLNEKW